MASFLQLQQRVDTGRSQQHRGTSTTTSPSALNQLLKREAFVSDPTISAAAASTRATQLSSPAKRGASVVTMSHSNGVSRGSGGHPLASSSNKDDDGFAYRSTFNLLENQPRTAI
jgi:hypothetical protein